MDHDASTNDKWTMDKVLLRAGEVVEILNGFGRRETELLEANNRYLQRARDAEAHYKVAQDAFATSLKNLYILKGGAA